MKPNMNKTVKKPENLSLFFELLNKKFGRYLVLRGYEHMPDGYSNDIDVFIPREDLKRFFYCVNNLKELSSKLKIIVSRYGLIKCQLLLNSEKIPFDIMYGFYYAGLEYQDSSVLASKSCIHHSGLFFIPHISDETRISLLKELLHNSRVRYDKAEHLLESIQMCSDVLPTSYFDDQTIKKIESEVLRKNYKFPFVSFKIKIRLLISNLRKNLFETFKRIVMFIFVKYVSKNKYHQKLTKP